MVLTVALGACHSGSEMRRALLRADSLMYSRPDSALAILRALDTDKATEAQFARYALLLTKAKYRNNVYEPDDSLISVAVDYYAGRGDSLEMQSLFYKGELKRWQNNSNDALILLAKAARIAVANNDRLFQGLIYRTQAEIYSGLIAYYPQLDASLRAIRAFEAAGAPHHAVREHLTAAQALTFIDPQRGLAHMDTVRKSPFFAIDQGLRMNYYDDLSLLLQATHDYQASADTIAVADSLGLVADPKTISHLAMAYANAGRHELAREALGRISDDVSLRQRTYTRFQIESYLDEAEGNLRGALDNMRLYDKYLSMNTDTLLLRPYTLALNMYIEAEAAAEHQRAADFRI